MISLTPSLQVAAVIAAVGWPLAAGLGLVMWSKMRSGERQRRMAALQGDLRGLYQGVAAQPTPDRLIMVMDALEEGEALQPRNAPAPAKKPIGAG
ncbi:hypothetical protein LRS10_13245 [Phenylobacterium sp. J426]|uniref:hypothetical protein n=1 Tax=Phenylobacterium sp. J426 TaxID=2898439 RepID=UPI002151B91D|nr:hypothetical protein [Phenylobacterium sp. J426]MCR5875062.1 hypothetical protein [Phenylobacterium sp. J426]